MRNWDSPPLPPQPLPADHCEHCNSTRSARYGGSVSLSRPGSISMSVKERMDEVEVVLSDTVGRPAVVHGMRSTFRNRGRDRTEYRPDLMELSLAHSVCTEVERAYARDTALEPRRGIMEAWAGSGWRRARGRDGHPSGARRWAFESGSSRSATA